MSEINRSSGTLTVSIQGYELDQKFKYSFDGSSVSESKVNVLLTTILGIIEKKGGVFKDSSIEKISAKITLPTKYGSKNKIFNFSIEADTNIKKVLQEVSKKISQTMKKLFFHDDSTELKAKKTPSQRCINNPIEKSVQLAKSEKTDEQKQDFSITTKIPDPKTYNDMVDAQFFRLNQNSLQIQPKRISVLGTQGQKYSIQEPDISLDDFNFIMPETLTKKEQAELAANCTKAFVERSQKLKEKELYNDDGLDIDDDVPIAYQLECSLS